MAAEDPQNAVEFDAWLEVVAAFATESDRASVVLAAARLDELLYDVLQRFLLPAPSANDELLGTERPLGTFSAKTHAAYRLGLIDANFARALHLVRKTRNTFAHESATARLDSGPHRDRIRELVALWEDPDAELGSLARVLRQAHKGKSEPAIQFYCAVASLMLRLQVLGRDVARTRPSKIASLLAPRLGERAMTGQREPKPNGV